MTARRIQLLIAALFFALGAWFLIAPASVMLLAVRPGYRTESELVPLLIAGLGAHAVLTGLFAAFSVFTKRTFFAFGAALLPFFWFDYHFYFVEPVFNAFILLDVLACAIFLVLCVLGYRDLSRIRS